MKHPDEEDLVLVYYREAGADPAVAEHLAGCPECRAEYEALTAALDLARSVPAREPRDGYEAELWRRLRSSMEAAPRRRLWHFPSARRLAELGAVAALVAVAFLIGRFLPRVPEQAPPASIADEVRRHILVSDAGEHLERTQRVLLEVVNAGHSVDLGAEHGGIEELLAANRLYRQAAALGGEMALALVLEDVERMLVEIAHAPARLEGAELESIRRQVDETGVLFKIRVMDSGLRQREAAALRSRARRVS